MAQQGDLNAVVMGKSFSPMMLGTKRKTFSEYVWAVAKSTATLASTCRRESRLRDLGVLLAEPLECLLIVVGGKEEMCTVEVAEVKKVNDALRRKT